MIPLEIIAIVCEKNRYFLEIWPLATSGDFNIDLTWKWPSLKFEISSRSILCRLPLGAVFEFGGGRKGPRPNLDLSEPARNRVKWRHQWTSVPLSHFTQFVKIVRCYFTFWTNDLTSEDGRGVSVGRGINGHPPGSVSGFCSWAHMEAWSMLTLMSGNKWHFRVQFLGHICRR